MANNSLKPKVGEIWKEDDGWKIQMPKGIWTTKTKKEAEHVSSLIYTNPKKEKRMEFLESLGEYVNACIQYAFDYKENPEYCNSAYTTMIDMLDDLEEKLETLLEG